MSGPIRLFVSSSPELQVEREIVGSVVAGLPLTIGWRIGHTPIPGEAVSADVIRVAQCDLYALILGHDFSAPMGSELRESMAAGRRPLAYRLRCTYSPSAQDAIRGLSVDWRLFSSPDELDGLLEGDLLNVLLERGVQLGLDLNEVTQLYERSQGAGRQEQEHQSEARRGDVSRGGVILGREIWDGA
jgi:hypothetical protein